MASKPEEVWADFDRLVAQAAITPPWTGGRDDPSFEPDFELLQDLLAVPLRHGSTTQSGLPAKAIDVWMAHELRRAGFPADEVWPRAVAPRVLPREVGLLRGTPGVIVATKDLFARIDTGTAVKHITSADAKILGRAYEKQVDVVMSQWSRGPEILVSTKRMDSSFGKNAPNRIEEAYGDAKNLRGRHPMAALGFLFVMRSTAFEKEHSAAVKLVDLLAKMGQESDGYDATGLIVVEWTDPSGRSVEEIVEDDEATELAVTTKIVHERIPSALDPARFIRTIVEAVLDRTPVDLHQHARVLRGQEVPDNPTGADSPPGG